MIGQIRLFRGGLLLGACLTFVGAVACTGRPDSQATPFPSTQEVAGWVRTGDIRTFQAADLWKYIDGEAERYLNADVRSVSTADYRFRDKLDAVVDIYTMGSESGVKKIMESESAPGAETIQLGDACRLFGQSMVFRKGPYLVRITAYESSPEMPPALLALARGVESRLGTRSIPGPVPLVTENMGQLRYAE